MGRTQVSMSGARGEVVGARGRAATLPGTATSLASAGAELVATLRNAAAYQETEAFLAAHRPAAERLRAQARQFAALGPERVGGTPWARGGRLL